MCMRKHYALSILTDGDVLITKDSDGWTLVKVEVVLNTSEVISQLGKLLMKGEEEK